MSPRVVIVIARALGAVLVALLLVLGLAFLMHRRDPGPDNYPVCSSSAPACIRIHEHDGSSFGLNDFRFYGKGCVSFISLPDHVQRSTCDPFRLEWVGTTPA